VTAFCQHETPGSDEARLAGQHDMDEGLRNHWLALSRSCGGLRNFVARRISPHQSGIDPDGGAGLRGGNRAVAHANFGRRPPQSKERASRTVHRFAPRRLSAACASSGGAEDAVFDFGMSLQSGKVAIFGSEKQIPLAVLSPMILVQPGNVLLEDVAPADRRSQDGKLGKNLEPLIP
jgi:hypothetical protein